MIWCVSMEVAGWTTSQDIKGGYRNVKGKTEQ